jgi:CRP-like cAMP-binding protein
VINAQWPAADRLATLRATPELAGWPERSLQAILWQFDEVTLPAGRLIAAEGRPCNEYVVVLEGRLAARSGSGDRRPLRAGDSFGWRAMWERGTNEACLTVESDARLLVMGHAQFRALKAEAGGRAA